MASNLDYLAPALIPLEEKAKAFLETEKALHRATEAQKQGSSAQRVGQNDNERTQNPQSLKQELARLEAEIIELLPTRNEWVKVNLGYGPSRVGAWLVPATDQAPEHYKVRVVH
ncbi:MAG TPA: hypothetical protein VF629_08670 [Hymenobacter sp.]|jgi:hypothetical protein|uniref:hypothetical protein n=1 Tax=Hymenobacter sp. TaxID=1898978 RepID=UPI002ED83BE1